MERLYVGVDGGGTKTRAVVAAADLVPRGRGAAGPASAAGTPLPRLLESVREAVADALDAARARASDVSLFSCGIAGVEGTAAGERIAQALGETYGGRERVLVTTDARIALAGATEGDPEGPGLVLIAGTGAVAFGRNRDGEEARAGGWGPLIGDEGSRYAIAVRGLSAVVRALDGRGPATHMHDLLFSSEGSGDTTQLLARLYRGDRGPADVAAYFPLVLEAARGGDAVALGILREAGEELALDAATVLGRLEMAGEAVAVATVGGVFAAGELVLGPLRERLLLAAPRARLQPPAYPPEIGAIRRALAHEARARR